MVVRVDAGGEETVQAFATYQRVERGLAERTVYNANLHRATFPRLACRCGLRCSRRARSAWGVHRRGGEAPGAEGDVLLVSTVRTFVRFLFVTGVTAHDLSGAVPSVKVCALVPCHEAWTRR